MAEIEAGFFCSSMVSQSPTEAEIVWEIKLSISAGRAKPKVVCCDYDKFFFLALSFSEKESANMKMIF